MIMCRGGGLPTLSPIDEDFYAVLYVVAIAQHRPIANEHSKHKYIASLIVPVVLYVHANPSVRTPNTTFEILSGI